MDELPATAAYNEECLPYRQHVEIAGVVQPYMNNHAAHKVATMADAMRDELLAEVERLRDWVDKIMATDEKLEWLRDYEEKKARVAELESEPKFQHGVLTCPYCGTTMRLEMGQIAEWTYPDSEEGT